jgi:hypothetical protein
LYDYPEYVKSGISVSARSYNIADIQITSQKNDIMISGTLNDKSQPGTVWLYIFGKPQEESDDAPSVETQNEPQPTSQQTEIPSWIKSNANWWADGMIGDNDFVLGIQHLINVEIIKIPQTTQGTQNTQQIPHWIKNNAKWWAGGLISDLDFVQGIQYLIRNGIIQIQVTPSQPTQTVAESTPEPQKLSFVSVNADTYEKQSHQTINMQITGQVENFKSGTYVFLTITKPDQSSYDLKGILTSKGQFTVPVMLDANSPTGKYTITAKYNNVKFDTTSFNVK